jgi:hypothetical protein
MTIKEGYRHYENPVAMPNLAPVSHELSLEEYFRNLDKQLLDEPVEGAKGKQVAGTHYQKAIQPWDIISEWELDFWEGNVLKYLLRWKFKDGVQDLQKAKHYLEYLIERNTDGNKENN